MVITSLQYGRSSLFCEDPISVQYVSESEQDRVAPWSEGGGTVPENLQIVSRGCNRRKGKKSFFEQKV